MRSTSSASVAAVAAALEVTAQKTNGAGGFSENSERLRAELRRRGFRSHSYGGTAIVPVVIQNEINLHRLCKALLEEGMYVNPVLRFPRPLKIYCGSILHGWPKPMHT